METDVKLLDGHVLIEGSVRCTDADGKSVLRVEGSAGGNVALEGATGADTVVLSGEQASVTIGGDSQGGSITVRDDDGAEAFTYGADTAVLAIGSLNHPATLVLRDGANVEALALHTTQPRLDVGRGLATLGFRDARAGLDLGGSGRPGSVRISDATGAAGVAIEGATGAVSVGTTGTPGKLDVVSRDGAKTLSLDGDSADLVVGGAGRAGAIHLRDQGGATVVHVSADGASVRVGDRSNAGDLEIRDAGARPVVLLKGEEATVQIGAAGHPGIAELRDLRGLRTLLLDGSNATLTAGGEEKSGEVVVADGNGAPTIRLEGLTGHAELTGAGCAEEFDIADLRRLEPAAVVVIDEDGRLKPCDREFDTRVAGVVAGGGRIATALTLDAKGGARRRAVAVAGKVMCKVDATRSPIKPGDLLTTSGTAGCAMKADVTVLAKGILDIPPLPGNLGKILEPILAQLSAAAALVRSFGAIVGKALAPADGLETIPVLVALQ